MNICVVYKHPGFALDASFFGVAALVHHCVVACGALDAHRRATN